MELVNSKTQFIIISILFFSIVIAKCGNNINISSNQQQTQARFPHHQTQMGSPPGFSHMQTSNQTQSNLAPPVPSSTNITHNNSSVKGKRGGHHKKKHNSTAGAQAQGLSAVQQPLSESSQSNKSLEEEFVKAHNRVRLHVGEPTFEWDTDLAIYAEVWANKRRFDCRMVHSYGPFGENIFWGLKLHWTPKEIVDSWASESNYYNATTNACQPQQDCGHYTQIVWRDSLKVGCARVVCEKGLGMLVVCSYDPPGNYENENPFVSYNATTSHYHTELATGTHGAVEPPKPL